MAKGELVTPKQPELFPDTDPARYGNGRGGKRLILPKILSAASRDARLEGEAQDRAHNILVKWADLESTGKLAKLKETALQGEFLAEVFGNALGYTLFSENLSQWHLQSQFSVPGGQADAAIGFFGSEQSDPPVALIELKGPKVNVDRDRFNGRTPVRQCWDYLYDVPSCPWGIVCNYVSFRLYHRNKTPQAFERFTLQELRDRKRFNQFYVLFERGGLLPVVPGRKPRALELLESTDNRQREVGRALYSRYHANRVALIDHLCRSPHKKSIDAAIHVAQKLLDRIVFVAFCEDRDLLPANTIAKAYETVPPFARVTNPRWQNFRNLFQSIDAGHEPSGINAYDGGLFRKDDEVDDLELGDKWTDFFKEIGGYDFRDEINVDVLGHLFEHSITDLEALRADPEGLGRMPRPRVSGKRKREGIYYTPPHVTRYIVEHTIGACLSERFEELAKRHHIDPDAEPGKKDLVRWVAYHSDRLETLRRFRVCDMACGSGAFLIQAFDYLESVYDDVIAALRLHDQKDERKLWEEVNTTILRENLFGVDRSHEAVEITQLALWIRTAERGKSLDDLSANIQCGNSIVDDRDADPLAFDWHRQFPGVFRDGGFDCIVTNPPYVKLQNFRKREPRIAAFLVERYQSAKTGNFDMYLPFIERGLDLLRPEGRLGFIAPNVWLVNEYGQGLRELVAERRVLERFVDFKSHQVFEDATTYTALQFFAARPRDAIEVLDAGTGELAPARTFAVPYARLGAGAWALLGETEQKILDKMRRRSVTLADASGQIFQGLITSADAVYHLIKLGPGRYFSKALDREVEIEDEIMKPLVSGGEAVPFTTPPTEKYLLFPYFVTADESRLFTQREMSKEFKRCWAYLRKCERRLRDREHGKMDHHEWFGYVYPKNLDKHERPKLLVPRLLLHLFAAGDPDGKVYLDNVDVGGILIRQGWDLHFVLGLLNSKACDFAWRLTSKPFRGDYRSANKQFIAPLPIPKSKDQGPVATLARELAQLHGQRLAEIQKVHRRFVVDLPPRELVATSPLPPKLPGKLSAFDERPLAEVLAGMEEFAQRKLRPTERSSWDEYLTTQIASLAGIKGGIADKTEALNSRLYKLFGLTRDEIKAIDEAAHR